MYSERKGQGACVSLQQRRTTSISWTGEIGGAHYTEITLDPAGLTGQIEQM